MIGRHNGVGHHALMRSRPAARIMGKVQGRSAGLILFDHRSNSIKGAVERAQENGAARLFGCRFSVWLQNPQVLSRQSSASPSDKPVKIEQTSSRLL